MKMLNVKAIARYQW